MTIEKIIGWILLFLGIAIIIYSLYTSFDIFTGKKEVPDIFKITETKTVLLKEKPQGIQGQMEELIQEQLTGLLPPEFIPKLLNLLAWSIIAGLLIFGGAQISGLGINLIKK